MRRRADVILVAMCTLALCSASLRAQSIRVSARGGLAIPADDYQSNCGDSSMAFSVDVTGRRQIFPQFSFDHFSGSGGGDILCLPVDPALGTAVGGLRLEGSTRLGLGIGGRLGTGQVQLEGVVSSGIVRGRHGFVANPQDDSRHVMPHVGGQATLILFKFFVLSAAANWTRLSLEVTPVSGGAPTTQTSWSPIGTLQVGVRVPP